MELSPKNQEEYLSKLLEDVPADIEKLALEFHAFTRARQIKTPKELLRAVLLYCGLSFAYERWLVI